MASLAVSVHLPTQARTTVIRKQFAGTLTKTTGKDYVVNMRDNI